MMRRLSAPLLVVTALLSGCASTAPDGGPQELKSITVSGWSWGREYERWTIDRYGSASHKEGLAGPPVGDETAPIETKLTITGAEFEAIAGLLDPVQQLLIDGVGGDCRATDQDSYSIEWTRGYSSATLSLYFGCKAESVDAAAQALADAHEKIERLPHAAPAP